MHPIATIFNDFTCDMIIYFGLQDEEPTASFHEYALMYNQEN